MLKKIIEIANKNKEYVKSEEIKEIIEKYGTLEGFNFTVILWRIDLPKILLIFLPRSIWVVEDTEAKKCYIYRDRNAAFLHFLLGREQK